MSPQQAPQPLADGFSIDVNDRDLYDWTIMFENGGTYTVTGLSQRQVDEWAVLHTANDYRERHKDNFESVSLAEVWWRDGVIHGKVQAEFWRDKNDEQFLADRMVCFTATPVLPSQ